MTVNRKKQNAPYLLSTLVIFALAVYGFLFYSVQAKTTEGAIARAVIARFDNDQADVIFTKNFLRTTEEMRAELNKHFITPDTIVAFIEELESLGRTAGIELSLASVEAGTPESPALKASFGMNGTFGDLHYFISLVEALPLELEIKRLTLSKLPAALGKSALEWEGEGSVELFSFLPGDKQ